MPWREVLHIADERMRTIRDAIGDSPDLAVDVHVAIRETSQALELVRVITPYKLMFIEEPAGAELIQSSAELRKNFRVALATGENLYGIHRFTELLNADAVDIIQPDILCCGKGASSGLPLAIVLGSQQIMDLPDIGSMSSTHSANPLCSISGHENLKAIIEDGLMDNSRKLGEIFHQKL